ncbi:MAG: DUF456 domain-containing protein [Anaerolineales bacterium]
MTDSEILLALLTFLVMLVGVVGVIVPVLPDVWLIWLAALGYGLLRQPLFDGWIGGIAMALLTLLTVLGVIADLALSQAGAAKGGASWQGILASIGLGLAGLFFFPPFGPLVGALLGLFLVEYYRQGKDPQRALQAVKGFAAGCGVSVIVRLAIALVMIGIWGAWVVIANF